MSTKEENAKYGFGFNETKTLNNFKKALIYLSSALQLYLSITIVALKVDRDFSGIYESILMNKPLLGFIIASLINWLIGWSIGFSSYTDENEKKKSFYSKKDRKIGRIISPVSSILFFTVIISFIVAVFEIISI